MDSMDLILLKQLSYHGFEKLDSTESIGAPERGCVSHRSAQKAVCVWKHQEPGISPHPPEEEVQTFSGV